MRGDLHIICGRVQGVGFRPAVWRVAHELGLAGDVRNTGRGVEVRLWGERRSVFAERLQAALPSPASIEHWEQVSIEAPPPRDFAIAPSQAGEMDTVLAPDLAVCADCLAEIRDPFQRRYRYAFANCTDCGPRFSIITGSPYDRAKTSMKSFSICADCAVEYSDPSDRRFHAQPVACHACGPRVWLEKLGGGTISADSFSMLDDADAVGGLLLKGFIVAIKGIGGFHLACDATREDVVAELRRRKRRRRKAFALMARDIEVIREYAELSTEEAELLHSPAAPILLLRARPGALPDLVAPGLDRLGFMLPYTPLHHLLMRRVRRPIVMSSGNISGKPQCIGNDQARAELAQIADFALFHDREIINRIDDSVVRFDLGRARILRRARGYAPLSLELPPGFARDRQVLALGSELKNTFCLTKGGKAILSQHMGDLENAATHAELEHNLELYQNIYQHRPEIIAVDAHPEYLSTKRGYAMAGDRPVIETQHHHAHIASCLAENGRPLGSPPVLGIAMDGLGMGDDGTVWGGEFLIADYASYRRAGCLKPVALIGGSAAVVEPWRNAYAHLMAEMGWSEFRMNFHQLELYAKLEQIPRETLDAMIVSGVNSPLSSSCGRLFDAAAAVAGLAWERQDHEAEAAQCFEAVLDPDALAEPEDHAYPFTLPQLGGSGLPYIEPLGVWRAMLGDLILATPVGVISARFHRGLARAIVALAQRIIAGTEIDHIALVGGCFQNATLFRLVHERLQAIGLTVLSHAKIPANDGGLALGQAVIAHAVGDKGG